MVRLFILVPAWLLISGLLGVVTLNSPGEVFTLQEVFPIRQQITKLFIFRCILVNWCFVGASTIYMQFNLINQLE